MMNGKDKPTHGFRPNSRILDLFDRFCDGVYDRLKNGVFGCVFTKCPEVENTLFARMAKSSFRKNTLSPLRRRMAATIENSLVVNLLSRLVTYLLNVRLRVYGVFLLSFLLYTSLTAAAGLFFAGRGDIFSVILPLCLTTASIPLMASSDPLIKALEASAPGRFIVEFSGGSFDRMPLRRRALGRSNIAFVIGLVLGVLTYFVSPLYIAAAIAALIGAAMVFSSPEFGTVCLFFFMPILPTLALIILASLTMLSFIIKVILAKRVIRVEAVDLILVPFIVTILTGTFFGASNVSLMSGTMTLVFTLTFYLVVFTVTSRRWLRRSLLAFVTSAAGISFYGLFQYATTKVAGENGWVDQEMFSYITGRAVATLDNPNMLAVYLVIALPVAASLLLTVAEGFRQKAMAFVCFAAVGACLVFTWTRGAWLGALVAAVVFVMIWSKRSVYLFACGVLSIPFLPYIIPQSIWTRFTSIGNVADSSTAYRINILKSVFRLLPDYILYGLGCGEECWYKIYPHIALDGVEWTAHSHNLYLQIWVQTGFVSMVFFLIFILVIFLSNFKMYKRLSDVSDSVVARIETAPLKESTESVSAVDVSHAPDGDEKAEADRKRTLLRLEAAAPLCGIFAALVMGFTDYVWYNYRVYLIFWLTCGLTCAYVRCTSRALNKCSTPNVRENESNSSVELRLEKQKERN